MEKIFLAIGSNVGDRVKNLDKVTELLEKNNVKVVQKSNVYETEPYGYKEQQWFYNQILEAQTDLSPESLLDLCLNIEKEIGRKKTFKWGPRVIDVDILLFGEKIIDQDDLKIPHPFLHARKFVLVPLNEIAPNVTHAGAKKTVNELLNECIDTAIVRPL
jgi:2-amino-4-hydroxy-6-hydroxymethyldihydropteridine diphosphokinase